MNQPPAIAYIFERYPVLTQTFLRREITGLTSCGVRVEIYAMMAGDNSNVAETSASIRMNYFRWWTAFKVVFALPWECFRDPTLLRDGWRLFWTHRFASRENFFATLWAIIFAFCQAPEIRRQAPDMLHGVRATGPATAAAILSRLCHIPFSFGAHVYDIYRHGGDAFLEPKIRSAKFVHTTTAAAVELLQEKANGAPTQVVLVRRGLETLPNMIAHDSTDRKIRLLSVGRLVAKKGHTRQIAACALLKSWNIPFEARIVGEGPLRASLTEQCELAGLRDSITLCGPLPPEQVEEEYRWADIFWHTGIVDTEGDRDGLPNVIPEAFAHCLPVVTTNLPGATEAVSHEQNGLVVSVNDAGELALAVKQLAENSELRCQLGENGRRWVEENFLTVKNSQLLANVFKKMIQPL